MGQETDSQTLGAAPLNQPTCKPECSHPASPVLVELNGKIRHVLQGLIGEGHVHVNVPLPVAKGPTDLQAFGLHCRQPDLQGIKEQWLALSSEKPIYQVGEGVGQIWLSRKGGNRSGTISTNKAKNSYLMPGRNKVSIWGSCGFRLEKSQHYHSVSSSLPYPGSPPHMQFLWTGF